MQSPLGVFGRNNRRGSGSGDERRRLQRSVSQQASPITTPTSDFTPYMPQKTLINPLESSSLSSFANDARSFHIFVATTFNSSELDDEYEDGRMSGDRDGGGGGSGDASDSTINDANDDDEEDSTATTVYVARRSMELPTAVAAAVAVDSTIAEKTRAGIVRKFLAKREQFLLNVRKCAMNGDSSASAAVGVAAVCNGYSVIRRRESAKGTIAATRIVNDDDDDDEDDDIYDADELPPKLRVVSDERRPKATKK